MKKLRLLVTDECYRGCVKCCNKQYDLASLPVCEDYSKYGEIMITGGEPMLQWELVISTLREIKKWTNMAFVYTADVRDTIAAICVIEAADGITLTLHSKTDIGSVMRLNSLVLSLGYAFRRSLRLNVFRGIDIDEEYFRMWKIKYVDWEDNCPIPPDEDFMRTENAITRKGCLYK